MSYQSFKWISSGEQKGSKALEVNEAVQHSVFKSVARSPCNLISIFGRARQGKSFLMNCLAGEKEIFRISNEKESCTQGIDISNKWCNWSDFERIDGGGGGGRTGRQHTDMKVGFVDAEGQGDKDVGYDANLICPILLTSKCVIFNWKGDLQKDHLLSTLGIMTRAAANVASETSSGTKASFGHLHIIFRDWQAEGASEQAVFDDIMKPERTEEGETRNLIRSQLKNSFQSIRVWLFVAPMERTKDLKQKLEYQKTCAEFRDQVRALRGALSGQLLEPTLFAGNALTGKTYVRLTQQVAQALNAGQSVLPSSAYLNMMKEEAQVLVQQYEQELRARMQTLLISLNDEVHHHQQQPQARSNSSSSHHKNAQSLYATLPDAQNRFSLLCKELTQEYVGRVSESIGGDAKATAARDAGSVAAAVLADFTTQLQEIGVNMQQHYQAAYGQQFTSWLLGARQAAEQLIDFQLLVLEKKLPIEQSAAPSTQQDNSTSSAATFSKLSLSANSGNRDTGGSSAATLEKELQSVLNAALRMIGGTDHYGAQCIEVVDASKILCRHHESRAQQLMQKNQQLLATSAARAEECLQAAVAAMEAELERSLDQHDSLYSSGYQLQLLQMALNKSYYQLRDENIRTALKDSVHLAGVEERFQASSVALSTLMLAAYRARKQRALTAAVQHGVGEIGDALTEMDIGKLWAGVDIDAREATMDLCLQDMQNRMEGSLLGSEVRGWLVLRQNRRFAPCPLNELLQTFHNNNNNITSSTSGSSSSSSVTGSSACEYSEVANALAAASQWELEELQMELAFVSELRSSMQQAARGFRDSGLALLQRLRYQERDAATKAAAVEAARAAAQQAEEEEEEEEEEEVGSQHDGATLIDEEEDEEQEMESPPPAAANKRSGSSSAAEQRRRAQEWAANNLAGMSNKKKKTRPSTASAAAAECRATEAAAASAGIQQGGRSRKSRSATAAAVLPPKSTKSVEQQRQDALAYARRVFGERVRIPSPPPPPLPLPSSTTGAGASAASSGRHSHKKRKTRDIHVDDDEMEAADAVNSSDNPFSANYNAHHPSSNLPSSISNPRRPGKENAPSLDQPSPPGPLASSSSSSSSATTATTTSSKAIHNTGSTKKGDKLRAAREEAKLIAQQRADAAAAAAADRVARNKAKKAAGKK